MMTAGIKNIIFDLGGVLLPIEFERTIHALGLLGLVNPTAAFSKHSQGVLFKQFERGILSEASFLERLSQETGCRDYRLLIEAWCALLGEMPDEIFTLLEKLSTLHSLFILSNTNIIHQRQFEASIDTSYGWQKFKGLFKDIVYSHHTGLRKPGVEIYNFILERNSLIPQETLFIDDTEQNLFEPARLGVKTHWLREHEDVEKIVCG